MPFSFQYVNNLTVSVDPKTLQVLINQIEIGFEKSFVKFKNV
jgi:hypothetical protein